VETISIVITIALVIVAIGYIYRKYRKSSMDKKVYQYAAAISEGVKDGPFRKVHQEVVIRKKRIAWKGYLNETYAIIQTNRGDKYTEYICKDRKNTLYLLLVDTDHQTSVWINKRQTGVLFSSDEPTGAF
jgi:cbb3-type cytochrome oxidase subunit 3